MVGEAAQVCRAGAGRLKGGPGVQCGAGGAVGEDALTCRRRRSRTYSLLVTGRERKAINRNYFNS